MTKYTLGFGCLIICCMVIFILFYPSHYLLARIFFALVLLLLLTTIYLSWKKDNGSLNLYREFTRHSTEMIDQNKLLTLYIPIFLGSLVLFLLVIAFELRSLYSSAPIYFTKSQIYYQFRPSSTTIWTILVTIQAIWGFAFLKEACTYESIKLTSAYQGTPCNGIISESTRYIHIRFRMRLIPACSNP